MKQKILFLLLLLPWIGLRAQTGSTEYAYDLNGNLTKDLGRGIVEIRYNYLNLPKRIVFSDGHVIKNLYGGDGRKLRTTYVAGRDSTVWDYVGNAVYENDSLKYLLTGYGYLSVSDGKHHYFLKDHLGSVRVVCDAEGRVEEKNDYYPFGGLMDTSTASVQPYKYCGKELDTRNGQNWYDYGARMYDPSIGRWHAMDPLAEQCYGTTPYGFCLNNPVNNVDPNGRSVWTKAGKGLLKVGSRVAKEGGSALWKADSYVSAFQDAIDDYSTLTDPTASGWDRMGAGMSLASELLPVSVGDLKDVGKAANILKATPLNTNKALGRRVYLRKGTKDAIRRMAPKTEDGRFLEPNLKTPIERGQEVWGHKSGHEWSKYQHDPSNANKTRKQVIEEQNNPNIYQIEDKRANASHKYEEKWRKNLK